MAEKGKDGIKSALEIAMEKVDGGTSPASLTEDQKERIAEVERTAAARIAELDIMTSQRLTEARAAGDEEGAGRMEKERAAETARIREKAERDKERIRGRDASAP